MLEDTTPRPIVALLEAWHQVERYLAVISFSLIAALIFSDVVGRELVGPVGSFLGYDMGATGIYGARKLSLFLLVIGAFAGLGVSVATGAQIVPQVAFKWVPERWNAPVDRLSSLVSGLLFLAVSYYGWVFVSDSRAIGTVMPGIDWPVWLFQTAIPVGFLSSGLRYLIFFIWPATAPLREENQE